MDILVTVTVQDDDGEEVCTEAAASVFAYTGDVDALPQAIRVALDNATEAIIGEIIETQG